MHVRNTRTQKDYPDWFANRTVSEYMDLLREQQRYVLNARDRRGRRIFVYRMGNTRAETTIFDGAQIDDMWYECILSEHETQLNGVVVILDCKDLPWSCLKWCQPKWIRIGAEKSDLLPLKHLEIHMINQSTLMNTITQAVRPLLSKALLAKVKSPAESVDGLCKLRWPVSVCSCHSSTSIRKASTSCTKHWAAIVCPKSTTDRLASTWTMSLATNIYSSSRSLYTPIGSTE